ncbi:hypothetical protein H6775_00710 [Candidatus Nomurabacteria bacterium]|nr:hypothetical protein [Candidatus Nomurabacteria bacterium]
MATTKRRLNITLSPDLEEAVKLLAERDQVPEATKISELLKSAIEIEEDASLLKIAEKRLKEKDAKYFKHNDFWRKLGF